MPRPSRARRPRLVTRPFVLVAAATLSYFVGIGILLPTVPLYVDGPLGGGDVAVGLVVGSFSVTALLARPWAGRVGDRRGRRPLMLVGGTVVALSVAGYVVADAAWTMVLLRLATGFGEGLFFVGAASVINDLAPEERRGEAVSFFSLSLYAGIGLGPIIGEGLARGPGFDAVWLASAGFAALAVLLAIGVRETRDEATRAAPAPGKIIQRAGLLPGAVLLASIWGVAGFFAFVPLYAPGIGLGGARGAFLLFSALVILIRLFGARIPDRLGPGTTSRHALLWLAVGLVVMGVWAHPAGLYLGTVALAVGQAFAFPGLMMLAIRGAPASERGAVIGTFTAFVDLGFGLGPASLGFVAAAVGYGGTFLAGAGVAAAGLALLLIRYGGTREPMRPAEVRAAEEAAATGEPPPP